MQQHDMTATRAKIRALRKQRAQLTAQLHQVQLDLQTQYTLNELYSPLGYYRYTDTHDRERESEAVVLDTDGEDLYISYRVPNPNYKESQQRWLRTPEERARFSSTRRQESVGGTRYFLTIGKFGEQPDQVRDCASRRIELAMREAIDAFQQTPNKETITVCLVDAMTRVIEFTVDGHTIGDLILATEQGKDDTNK